jgi:hypothetical protein
MGWIGLSQLQGLQWIEASFHFAQLEGLTKGFIERAGIAAWKAGYIEDLGAFEQERQQYLAQQTVADVALTPHRLLT